MASTSSLSPSLEYDVFLSFRGIDTRNNIVSHLDRAFRNKQIHTFIDYRLESGDEISSTLIDAIEQSKISVIIFSENYADSRWCLEELVKIIECKKELNQSVIPVFYKTEPTDVRHQTGKFGSAFNRLLKKYEIKPVMIFGRNMAASQSGKEQISSDALKSAAGLSGHSFNNGSEATLVDTIIADVLEKLKSGSNNACDHTGLVGINSRVEKIIRLLSIESPEIVMVGIWGMGGIGKTTIAEAVFNKLSSEFNNCCFLGNVREKARKKNVRETAKKDGLGRMRNKLISKLLKETLEIETPHIGNQSTKDRLRRTKALVVLDDVDNSSQLEALIGKCGTNQFGRGSRVIVTTRDKQVLNAHDIKHVYNMEMLDDNDALQLFRYSAFGQNQPFELYPEISKKIVEYAQGVPLALKLLGSVLHGQNDLRHWEGVLKKLKNVPRMEILEVLKISYDSLDVEEKEIFLDIACFFNHYAMNRVENILDGCYHSVHSGMKVLIDKSLINIRDVNRVFSGVFVPTVSSVVEMHDLIQEMGWNIVNEESKTAGSRSRLWRTEDVRDVLTRNTGTHKIKGIFFHGDWREEAKNCINLDPQAFAKMYNLKYLNVDTYDYKIMVLSGLESLPEGIRYLEWYDYPLETLPTTINPTNLVELRLSFSHTLKRLWSGRQDLRKLKFLYLKCLRGLWEYSLLEIPDLSLATNLESLSLENISVLDKMPSWIQNLTSLKELSLQGWTSLTEIPSSIQNLTSLKELSLESCSSLMEIPSSIQNLTSLTYLSLLCCYGLTKISSSIQDLKSLTHLVLYGCRKLTEIPPSIQHLDSLIYLDMSCCEGITKLPDFPKNIKFLEVDLILTEGDPSPIALLTQLVELVLWNDISDSDEDVNQMYEDVNQMCLKKMELLTPPGCKIMVAP